MSFKMQSLCKSNDHNKKRIKLCIYCVLCFISVCPSEMCWRKYKCKYAFHKYCFRDSICVRLSEWKITKPSFNHSNLFSFARTKSKRPTQWSEKHASRKCFLVLLTWFFSRSRPPSSSWRCLFIILEVSTSEFTSVWFPGHTHQAADTGASDTGSDSRLEISTKTLKLARRPAQGPSLLLTRYLPHLTAFWSKQKLNRYEESKLSFFLSHTVFHHCWLISDLKMKTKT